MAQCLFCGKQYHACSSCGLEPWEFDFCCERHRNSYRGNDIAKLRDRILAGEDVESLAEEFEGDHWLVEEAAEAARRTKE